MIRGRGVFLAIVLCMAGSLPLLVSPLPAQQPSDRAHQIGGKFMCMCGCNQVLSQCNHVGCTVSTSMLKEVDQALARGDSEDSITQAFVQEFGTKVYAEPPRRSRFIRGARTHTSQIFGGNADAFTHA